VQNSIPGYEWVKKVRKSALYSLLILIALLAMPAALAENGIYLSQFSEMYGQLNLLISNIGCKIESKSHNYVVIAKPPAWNVIVFNPRRNVYTEIHLKDWDGPYPAMMHKGLGTKFLYLTKTTTETDTFQKLTVTRIRYKLNNVSGGVKDYLAHRAYLSVTNDIPAPTQLQKVIYLYYSIPTATGIPLEFDWMDRNMKWQKYVGTNSWRNCSCRQKDFEIPANAKKMKTSVEVVVSDLQEGMFDTFFGSDKK
jgi:hypothetical protein